MILRFKTVEPVPRYVALNTKHEIYTTDKDDERTAHEVSPGTYDYILRELDFNSWDYSEDILHEPREEDVELPF